MDWTTAVPDWERRIVGRESLIPLLPLFPAEAASAEDVFRELRIVDALGSPTMGSACREWVFEFVRAVFGSYDPEAGRRLIREYLLLVSKKNSKSTIAAGIMLTALIRNWRMAGEFLILAPTIEIANNCYAPARDMVRADPELSDLLNVQDNFRTITHRRTKATLKVVAADNETVGGKKAIGVFVDELWLFGKRANAENMLREATGGLASRPEGFVIFASTQSDEPPAGIFKQKLKYARDVRDGVVDDKRFLPVLYEFPERMIAAREHRDRRNFYVTNPNLGASVDEEFLEREFDKAVNAGEDSLRGFLSKHLNVEIGMARGNDSWAGADYWEAAGDTDLTLEALLERCECVCIGIDGGGLDDLLGLAVLGREKATRNWLLWSHAWAHRSVLERRKSEAPRIHDLAALGQITIVERLGDDIEQIADICTQVDASGLLAQVGLDPVGVGLIVDALADRGIEGTRVVGVSQGWKLSGAIKTAERKLADGTLRHSGLELMAWAVGNAKVEPKGNALTITKQTAGTAKIDPLMAAFDAIALMGMNPEAVRKPEFQMMTFGAAA